MADSKEPLWKNIEEVLGKMTKFQYFNRPKQMAYHDLCTKLRPPKGIGATLGLGLKFCIQKKHPPNNLEQSFQRFISDVRKRFIFAGKMKDITPSKIYIKSTWIPDPAEEHVEQRLQQFIQQVELKKKVHQLNSIN